MLKHRTTTKSIALPTRQKKKKKKTTMKKALIFHGRCARLINLKRARERGPEESAADAAAAARF